MKNLIKFLIILLLIAIIILIIIISNLNIDDNNIESKNTLVGNEYIDTETPQDQLIELSNNTVKEQSDYVVFSVNKAIQKYFDYTTGINENLYYIQDVYTLQDFDRQIYYTYGLILKNNKITDGYFKVKVANELFVVETLELEEYNNAKQGKINKLEDVNIEKNEWNKYQFINYSSKELAEKYINDFIIKIKYSPDIAYTLLEDSYKQKRFINISSFKNYINNNNKRFDNFSISTSNIEIKENSTEYIVLDGYNNYYKIIVYSAMNYQIILEK